MQVVVIQGYCLYIQDKVNAWLTANPNITVTGFSHSSIDEYIVSVMILYRPYVDPKTALIS